MVNAAVKERIAASPNPRLVAWRFREMLAWDPDDHAAWERSIDGMTPHEVADYLVDNASVDQVGEILAELEAIGMVPTLQ